MDEGEKSASGFTLGLVMTSCGNNLVFTFRVITKPSSVYGTGRRTRVRGFRSFEKYFFCG